MSNKMDFDNVYIVFEALHCAFHPDGIDEGTDIDERLRSLFILFLHSVGWTEDEFWDSLENEDCEEQVCEDCKKEEQEKPNKKNNNNVN